ncbi:MAG TPA: glycosyltransferase [Pyrinomonadaceae bacterium]|nr:glycosyltransferase [Pyrinomonadaceae bacterium]
MRICLIGTTHPCHNPRLLREADSLAEAGHEVRVVSPSYSLDLAQKDERLMAKRKWSHRKVDYLPAGWKGKSRSIFIRGRRRLAFEMYGKFGGRKLAEYGYTTALPEQTRLASIERADWYIAHAHAALPVAAAAAQRWSARLGFDCEDLLSEAGTDPADIVRLIEKAYLPRCDYISVPSDGIARWLEREYSVDAPLVLYNVFPLYLAEGMLAPETRPENPTLRLHWFSQTIGPGRGIEEAIEAAGLLGPGIELHLRGNPSRGYRERLETMALRHQVSLTLHGQLDHDALIRSMQEFDVGLALERPEHTNYSLTVTNKIFSYLLAGLAVAATDTPGQREVLQEFPAAGFLYPGGSASALAEGLRGWLSDRCALREAQQAAWDAARAKYCWDVEQEKFLRAIQDGQGLAT